MSEPNPQEGMAAGIPPTPNSPQPAPGPADAPAGGINVSTAVLGIAVVLVGVLVIMIAMSGSGGGGDAPGDAITTKSGLKYVDLKVGNGKEAKDGDKVKVHYTGTLKNGTVFDSSVGKKPFEFELGIGKVIKGWDEGVAGMREGGKRKLFIPPELGYGRDGAGKTIPPNAHLVFEVELLKVN